MGLVVSNWAKIGENKWNYISKMKPKSIENPISNLSFLDKHCKASFEVRTTEQRTVDWFILRQFTITSTVACTVLNRIYRLRGLNNILFENISISNILNVINVHNHRVRILHIIYVNNNIFDYCYIITEVIMNIRI